MCGCNQGGVPSLSDQVSLALYRFSIFPFLTYALLGFIDGLRGHLEYVWHQQWSIARESFVHPLTHDPIQNPISEQPG